MNGGRTSWVRGGLAAACLVAGGSRAGGQDVQFDLGGLMPVIGRFMPQVAEESGAIGDPWWDSAAPKPQAAKPAGEENADQANMMRHFAEQQGLTILRRELSVVRQTCPSLEKQQRALVLEAGRRAVDKLVANAAAAGGPPARQVLVAADAMEAAIGDALLASVAANAAADEAAAYKVERGLRQERVKQATIAAIVADVDRDAFLDDAEREALARVLAESYRTRWRQAVLALQQGGVETGAAPPGVERCVAKALGGERRAEWLARRQQAGELHARAGDGGVQVNGGNAMVRIQVGGDGGAVRRVIRRRVVANADGLQMQLEVQVGAGAAAEAGEGGAEEDEP